MLSSARAGRRAAKASSRRRDEEPNRGPGIGLVARWRGRRACAACVQARTHANATTEAPAVNREGTDVAAADSGRGERTQQADLGAAADSGRGERTQQADLGAAADPRRRQRTQQAKHRAAATG